MKEEELLRHAVGKKNSFKIPDGYLDNLSGHIMRSVPVCDASFVKKDANIRKRLRIFAYAAVFCGLLCISSVYYMSRNNEQVAHFTDIEPQSQYNEDSYMEEIADCAMLDDMDLYSYLSDE